MGDSKFKMYREFKTLDEFKQKASIIKKGSIIPTRVLRCSKRKKQHKLRASCDLYFLPTLTGNLVVKFDKKVSAFVSVKGLSNAVLKGSTYVVKGQTHWIDLNFYDGYDFLTIINKQYLIGNGVAS